MQTIEILYKANNRHLIATFELPGNMTKSIIDLFTDAYNGFLIGYLVVFINDEKTIELR